MARMIAARNKSAFRQTIHPSDSKRAIPSKNKLTESIEQRAYLEAGF